MAGARATCNTSRTALIKSEQDGSDTDSCSEDETKDKAAAATAARRKRGKTAREAIEASSPVAKLTGSKKEEPEREEPGIKTPSGGRLLAIEG